LRSRVFAAIVALSGKLAVQLILFIGLQGSGKSTFYARSFADTHVRINLDMLGTRHRERLLLGACIEGKTPTVIDNTNPTPEERARYIVPARAAGFAVIGYYFQSRVDDCKARNAARPIDRMVPLPGLLGTYKRLVLPTLAEGFDALRYVRIDEAGAFVVQEWSDEVR
jgi:predicted kinase